MRRSFALWSCEILTTVVSCDDMHPHETFVGLAALLAHAGVSDGLCKWGVCH